jgi:hypothetical protein
MINKILISKITMPKVLVILAAFILPVKAILLLVGFMIIADTILGLIAANKNGFKITSRRLSAVVTKFVLYQGAVLLFFCIEKFIMGDLVMLFTSVPLFLTKVVATVLVGIEFLSITENIKKAWGVNVWTKIKEVLTRAKEVKQEVGEALDDAKEIKDKINGLK